VENEALNGALQRLQFQSSNDQEEIERFSGDLSQGRTRVAELQDMVAMLNTEKQELSRGAGDGNEGARDELQKLTSLLTEAEARLVRTTYTQIHSHTHALNQTNTHTRTHKHTQFKGSCQKTHW